jgi:hypothetical protein
VIKVELVQVWKTNVRFSFFDNVECNYLYFLPRQGQGEEYENKTKGKGIGGYFEGDR